MFDVITLTLLWGGFVQLVYNTCLYHRGLLYWGLHLLLCYLIIIFLSKL